MRYETDPALQISYPGMTDARHPTTAAYLRAAGYATELRRTAVGRIAPVEFAAYRDAVGDLERAVETAEHRAEGAVRGSADVIRLAGYRAGDALEFGRGPRSRPRCRGIGVLRMGMQEPS